MKRDNDESLIKHSTAYIGLGAIVLAILSLLLPILTVKYTDSTYRDLYLWDFFSNVQPFNWAMYGYLALLVSGGVLLMLGSFVKKECASAAAMVLAIAVVFIILQREFYSYNPIETMKSVKVSFGVPISALFVTIGLITSLSSFNNATIKSMSEDGILIALAFVFNLIKVQIGSTGGSFNFQMLPLFLIAIRRGPMHAFVSGGIIFGLITCLTDGYGFATYPFDYLIGFGSVMALGFFRKLILNEDSSLYNLKSILFIIVGCVLATLIRLIGSTASSMIIYEYDFAAALAYNAAYIPLTGGVAMIILIFLLGPIKMIEARFPADGESF